MRGVGTNCRLRSVFLAIALTATILSGCSRPSPSQSNLNESTLATSEERHKVIVKDIYGQGIKIIQTGNAFKDAWDLNHSLFNFGAGPTDAKVVDLGNSYIEALNGLRNKLLQEGVKETLRAAVASHNNFNESNFNNAYTTLCDNLKLAGGGTINSISKLNTTGKVINNLPMSQAEVQLTTFKYHNDYLAAIIRDLNNLLAPYATFTMGYEAPAL